MPNDVVLFQKNVPWEIQFVQRELLRDIGPSFSWRFVDTAELLAFVPSDSDGARVVVVFSSNLVAMRDLEPALRRLRPRVIVHLSDEDGTKPEFMRLGELATVVLRQHRFASYPPAPNVHHIPLGYISGFVAGAARKKPARQLMPGAASGTTAVAAGAVVAREEKEGGGEGAGEEAGEPRLRPMAARSLSWAFVGAMRPGGRREMLEIFSRAFPADRFDARVGGGVAPTEMAAIYGNARFVPNGRGCVRLDCFRLYEAVFAGAVPVTVGDRAEISETFFFEGAHDLPPFLFADSWDEAAARCHALEADPEALQALQDANVAWLHAHLELARARVAEAMRPTPRA